MSDRAANGRRTEIGQSVASTSHHLRAMARAGVLRTRREGTRIVYLLASDRVADVWAALRDIATEHVAGINELADAYLEARLQAGDTVVLDVRPSAEYEAGHTLGAPSVPVGTLRRLRLLSKDIEIVAYCRGLFCVYADEAVGQLRRRGFDARRLEDVLPEWKRAGLPIAAGTGG